MTSGYSGTPLAKKLGIKSGMTVAVVGFSGDYAELVAPVPEGVELISLDPSDAQSPIATLLNSRVSDRNVDLLHIFTNSRDELFRVLDEARGVIRQDGKEITRNITKGKSKSDIICPI